MSDLIQSDTDKKKGEMELKKLVILDRQWTFQTEGSLFSQLGEFNSITLTIQNFK